MRIIGVFCVLYALIFGSQIFTGMDYMEIGIGNGLSASLLGIALTLFFVWLSYLCFKQASKKENPAYIKKQEEIKATKVEAEERIKRAKMETENYRNLLRKQIEAEIKREKIQTRTTIEKILKQEQEMNLFINREKLKKNGIPSCPKCGSTYITTVFKNGASKNVCSFCGFEYFPSQYI